MPLFVPLLRTGTEDIQWKLVGTGRQERKDQGKGKFMHTKQQHYATQAVYSPDVYANGEKLASMKQLHAQIAAVSKALTELEVSEDKELMQPLESRLTDLKARLHGTRPIGQQVDGLRGFISRCQKRLAEARSPKRKPKLPLSKRQRTWRAIKPNSQNSNHSSLHPRGFAKQTSRTMGCPNGWRVLCHQSPNTCWKAVLSTERLLLNHFLD